MVKTPEWFKAVMINTANMKDTEASHAHADEVMCAVLKELGYSAGIEIFRKMAKWYS